MNTELLHKYFRGEASAQEEARIVDWVDASDENRKSFQKERMLFDVSLFSEVKKSTNGAKWMPILRWSVRVAAVLLLFFSGSIAFKEYRYDTSAKLQTITVPAGQRAQITLADGTTVWLNSESKLTYAANFGRDERNVELDGEAFFEVSKNKSIPFFVNTESNRVRVVGTSFNVCAYYGSDEFETSLVEGIVDIYDKTTEHRLTRLAKDEMFSGRNGRYTKSVMMSQDFLRWREGLYCFDDVPLKAVFGKLEKYYNKKILVKNPTVLDYHCTGKFNEQDGIEHILRVIQKDRPFTYRIDEEKREITIE